MPAKVSSLHQNFTQEKKSTDAVEKDIRKWVESVVEFKASIDKHKSEAPLEKHLKKIKKFKVKRRPSMVTDSGSGLKNMSKGERKPVKIKKIVKKVSHTDKPRKKESKIPENPFDEIKESYRNLKLPQNWTSGVSGGRVVFNRIKVTTHNSQQKMVVEKSLVITKDRNIHVLINGSEITLNNWEIQKIDKLDDIKKAIKEIDSLKITDEPGPDQKSPQPPANVVKKKSSRVHKSENSKPQKSVHKKPKAVKKKEECKGILKQKSFQL